MIIWIFIANWRQAGAGGGGCGSPGFQQSGVLNMIKRVLSGLAASLALAGALAAAEVAEVVFEQEGVNRLSTDQLAFSVQLRGGVEFSREKLDADVKRLYATGNFSDIVTEASELPDGRIRVLFRVRLRPRISRLDIQGNAKFKTPELAEHVSLAEGGLLNEKELRDTLNNLRKFYADHGYRDARIEHTVLPDGDEQVILTIRISENLRLRVNDVKFEGAEHFSQWDLRHSIANQYSYMNWLPFLNDYLNMGLLDRRELELDKARLRDKYHDAGYLDFKVEEIRSTPDPDDPEYVDLTFVITEGEPYTVSSVTVNGNTVYSAEELLPLISLHAGNIYSRTAADNSARAITSLYETLGYADVQCRVVRREDFENHTVALDFVITEGRKYFVRGVQIVGNTDTKDKVIRRELAIQPGDPVDRNRLEVSRSRLLGMGYFTRVAVDAVNADALNEKDIRIEVEEKPQRYDFRIGAGVSDINSFFGMAELSANNFDITNPMNGFYGGGQRMRIQGIYGIENAGFNVDFVEPWLFDLPIRFELSSYMNLVEYDQWDEWRVGARTSVQRKIFDDFTTVALGYKFEVVRIDDVGHRLKKYLSKHDLDGTSLVSQPSLMIGRDTRDSMTDPTEGYNINLFGAISPQIFGSSTNFYTLEAKGSYYLSFFDKAIVAMVGGKVGTVGTFDGEEAPLYERYFLGGGNSLRGFEYRTVSPTYKGENIGGQTMLLLTAEVSHPIWGPVRGAAFVDVGNAWADEFDMDFSEINIGAGYGLRVKIPQLNVPIRLDIAYPVLNNSDNRSRVRIHFNVGFTF